MVPPPERLHSLDGLRGLAAVVVVIHHALLTFPAFADAYYGQISGNPVAWALSYTPLHAFWAGTEAVYLFFVLSGIVLVLPIIRHGRAFSWAAYYPRRILRLYIPVAAAVIFGAILVLLARRFQGPGLGPWMNSRTPGYTVEGFVRDIVLVFGPSRVISPLWSLRWEVLFSLLLPLFALFALALRGLWWFKLVATVGITAAGSIFGSEYLFFLPIFAIGALLISEWNAILKTMARLDGRRWAWPTYLTVAVVLTTATWVASGLGATEANRYIAWVPILGVTMIVISAATFTPFKRFLETSLVAWLGTVSFALYLVHEPIIIAARFLTYPLSPWIGLAIAVPLAFAIAWFFAKYIEQPAHRFSKWVGAKTSEYYVHRRDRPSTSSGDPTVP